MPATNFEVQRRQMLAEISATTARVRELIGKAALDERVMRVMGKVPRHEFVPIELQPYAYANRPLPIGFDKTISQPFIVALMTDLLEIGADNTVLEIGTGLGYQTAPRTAGQEDIQHRDYRRAWATSKETTASGRLRQRRAQDCEWLSWLVG